MDLGELVPHGEGHVLRSEPGAAAPGILDRLGYRSEAAFARAFKRVIGLPPGAARRAAEA
ncbi:MAG: hypothetical protein ACRDL0_13380 [Thermoleophilaceae bacterium]